MVALISAEGSFTATWVQSHQEGAVCNNEFLVEQRVALALTDRDTAAGYESLLPASYRERDNGSLLNPN